MMEFRHRLLRKSCDRWQWLLPLVVTILISFLPLTCANKDRKFKYDIDHGEHESGELFQLHSEGTVAETIDLDRIPEIKRVACVGDRLMILMNDSSQAHKWQKGQVVIGGPHWGCNATRQRLKGSAIYVKIASIFFPLEGQVTMHHMPAGPFDILEEAKIHFHYQPGNHHAHDNHREGRFRRSLSNLASQILNNVNWKANFSTLIPFETGYSNSSSSSPETVQPNLALHKNYGDEGLSIERGQNLEQEIDDDFALIFDQLNGDTRLTYTFDLVIRNVDGSPKVERYISQFDVETNLRSSSLVRFKREIGLTYAASLIHSSPVRELLRVPVMSTPGLPPVFLTVGHQAETWASVAAYSAGRSDLRTAYNGTGFLTVSQLYDPVSKTGSDVTSRNWSLQSNNQSLASIYSTDVTFGLYQQLRFFPAVSWHYHDVDIELSPPVEITILPTVHVKSTRLGLASCVNRTLFVSAHTQMEAATFTADAFELKLWNVPLQPALTRDQGLAEFNLGSSCRAGCHGPSTLYFNFSDVPPTTSFVRGDELFVKSLTALDGDVAQFSENNMNATWCGSPATSCHRCDSHSSTTSLSNTCAARLMTPRMARALTYLADLVEVEWPDKQLLIREAWDERTSEHPSGLHADTSLYKQGRAAAVGLVFRTTSRSSSSTVKSLVLDPVTLDRFGQLAVCAGIDSVQQDAVENRLQVSVSIDDVQRRIDDEKVEKETMFWSAMNKIDVSALYPQCVSAPNMPVGSSWPLNTNNPDQVCGSAEWPHYRGDRKQMNRLIFWNITDASLSFEPEGNLTEWCGSPTRKCVSCENVSLDSQEPWLWCGTRMMTPRLALRLRKLQKLAEMKRIGIHVLQSFTEVKERHNAATSLLYTEGRGIKMTTRSASDLASLASLAVCAGFDFVINTDVSYIEAFVKTQSSYQALLVNYIEGPARVAASPIHVDDSKYDYPIQLDQESIRPVLLDGTVYPDIPISEHLTLQKVMSLDGRYFRLDPSLLECLELVMDDFKGTVQILPGSIYRTRLDNFMRNLDVRHEQERWRFQAGLAMELRPKSLSSADLLSLAQSVLRECPSLVRLQQRGVGLGCHKDYIYMDIRPLIPTLERLYVSVWEAEPTDYCTDVMKHQKDMIEGGPVIQSDPAITCKNRGLDLGLEFLSFQFDQASYCVRESQLEFCQASRNAREIAADKLQELLTSAAGHGRLPRHEIIGDIKSCLVELCGGCPGSGQIFDEKVRKCSRLVHKYIESAASAFPDLNNVTTFYNTEIVQSTVHALACRNGYVCVENTPVYSLLLPTVTMRYYPDPKMSLEKSLFSADFNPTPLLELVAQEMAFRAKDKVQVFVENVNDVNALREVLKVLMVYNQQVSMVEFQVAPEVDIDMVTSSIQRKVEGWSGAACPQFSRFAVAPFTVEALDSERHRRSVEDSSLRNKARASIYDWEKEWLNKMSY